MLAGLGVGDGRCIAGVSVCDGVGLESGSASVGILRDGDGVGVGGSIEGATAPGLEGEPDPIDGRGRGLKEAGGVVEKNGATVAPIGPEPPVVGGAGDGLKAGIPRADTPFVPGRAEDPPGWWGRCRTWMETADSARKAIAPAEITMTGTVLPAGWERTSVPSWPTVVLIRSATSASASCAGGSGGQ